VTSLAKAIPRWTSCSNISTPGPCMWTFLRRIQAVSNTSSQLNLLNLCPNCRKLKLHSNPDIWDGATFPDQGVKDQLLIRHIRKCFDWSRFKHTSNDALSLRIDAIIKDALRAAGAKFRQRPGNSFAANESRPRRWWTPTRKRMAKRPEPDCQMAITFDTDRDTSK
jgi:hypothetical protein